MKENKFKNFLNRFGRILMGIIILPFLYGRYSFILFLPFLFIYPWENGSAAFLTFSLIYSLFFGFIMGNLEVMNIWTKMFQRIFNIKYERKGDWTSNALHSFSTWSHPTIVVRGKTHKLAIKEMGGNLYNLDASIRRKAIFYWFFT